MNERLYSLRMRATRQDRHHCGAERLGLRAELVALAATLVERALEHAAGEPDAIHCTVERIDGEVVRPGALPAVRTWLVDDHEQGRWAARKLLHAAGVSSAASARAIELLDQGPAPGDAVMRGAMILDAVSGERLEGDAARGVRVSRMDLEPACRVAILAALAAAGLAHPRTAEALVLAAKVVSAPNLVAELCWSDDPDYLTGYVADPAGGYQRISRLKSRGAARGGRALFVARPGFELARFTDYLERQAVLFDRLGPISPPTAWQD